MSDLSSRNQAIFREASFYWNSQANSSLAEINRQLLTLSVALITISGSALVVFPHAKFEVSFKVFIAITWFLLAVTVALGLVQTYIDAHFFRSYSLNAQEKERIWSSDKMSDIEKYEKVTQISSLPKSTGEVLLIFQSSIFFAAFIMQLVLATILLFS